MHYSDNINVTSLPIEQQNHISETGWIEVYVDSPCLFNFDVKKMEIYVNIKMSMWEITFISCRRYF